MRNLKITGNDNEWQPKYIEIAAMLFVAALLITAVVAPKIIQIGFLTISAATLVYPLTCIFGDALTEVYGFNRTRRIVWVGLICEAMLVFFTWLAIQLPAAEVFTFQDSYAQVLGSVPRIVLASFTAYLFCEFINSYIMSRMKVWMGAKNFSVRAMASTIVAQGVDSAIFFVIAFWGILPNEVVFKLIITTWIIKSLYEFFALPFTITFVKWLKKREGVEHFDKQQLSLV